MDVQGGSEKSTPPPCRRPARLLGRLWVQRVSAQRWTRTVPLDRSERMTRSRLL